MNYPSPLVHEGDVAAGQFGAVAAALDAAERADGGRDAQNIHEGLLAGVHGQALKIHKLELGRHLGHVAVLALLDLRPAAAAA